MKHVVEVFEGFVLDINKDTFWGRFEDLDGNLEEAEFITDRVLLKDEDKEFLQEGAYFTVIFYNNETFDFNFIKEVWTQEQIDEAKKEAEELSRKLRGLSNADND